MQVPTMTSETACIFKGIATLTTTHTQSKGLVDTFPNPMTGLQTPFIKFMSDIRSSLSMLDDW